MVRLRRNNQAGFTLVESIVIVVLLIALGFAVYFFGWGRAGGLAGEQALNTDVKTMQNALGDYILTSNGLYPTSDGMRPNRGEYRLIVWYAGFTKNGKKLSFYPDFIARLPKHWNEAVWRIDSVGNVSVNMDPKTY